MTRRKSLKSLKAFFEHGFIWLCLISFMNGLGNNFAVTNYVVITKAFVFKDDFYMATSLIVKFSWRFQWRTFISFYFPHEKSEAGFSLNEKYSVWLFWHQTTLFCSTDFLPPLFTANTFCRKTFHPAHFHSAGNFPIFSSCLLVSFVHS